MLPPVHVLNGAVYVAGSTWVRNERSFVTDQTAGFIMPLGRSLDIDSEFGQMRFKTFVSHSDPDSTAY